MNRSMIDEQIDEGSMCSEYICTHGEYIIQLMRGYHEI